MQIQYCDLCEQPIKDGTQWLLYLSSPKIYDGGDYYKYLEKIEKDHKEICSTCKLIIDKIFELRLKNLNQLSNELLGIYKMPTYNGKKKNKGGEKK